MPRALTREAVLAAVAECDQLGRPEFLKKYGYGKARDYFLVVAGVNYDSKAIAGAAYGHLENGAAKDPNDHTGGITDAAAKLLELGFTITTPGQNADWNWEEHVLALDLYRKLEGSRYTQTSPAVVELSELLSHFGRRRGLQLTEKFRNTNGVYKKLMNFRAIDPAYPGSGLKHGNKLEKQVWKRYATDIDTLQGDAALIRETIQDPVFDWSGRVPEDEDGVAEGEVKLRVHYSRERDAKLAAKKRAEVLRKTGKLACEVCELELGSRYGRHGEGFIEVHHKAPLSSYQTGRKTKLSELACVCSNCHRMLHRHGLQTIEWLREQLL